MIDKTPTLGDILADALKLKGTNMKKVEFDLVCNSEEKISSIRDIRSAIPGITLTNAKAMYEATSMGGAGWNARCRVRVSMEQFGNFASFVATDTGGNLGYTSVRIIEATESPTFDLTL